MVLNSNGLSLTRPSTSQDSEHHWIGNERQKNKVRSTTAKVMRKYVCLLSGVFCPRKVAHNITTDQEWKTDFPLPNSCKVSKLKLWYWCWYPNVSWVSFETALDASMFALPVFRNDSSASHLLNRAWDCKHGCSQLMKANNAPSRQTGAWVAYMLDILFETSVATLLVVSQHVHIRYKLNLKIKPHCRGPTLRTHTWFAIAALHEAPFTAPAYSKSRLWMLLDISSSLRPNSSARFLNSWETLGQKNRENAAKARYDFDDL
jgi:hypothetical protein